MEKIDFLSAGESENTAITFTCIFLGKIFLESLSSNSFQSINLRCLDANQAHKVDKLLWEQPKEVYIPHKLSNDKESKDCDVEISYPGIKVNREFDLLLNLNPQLPSNYLDFSKVFQIVIKDGSEFQNKARLSYKKCLEDKINPNFID
ncbi:MAG: DNA polymerase III subunit chi [Gammaproteobacteria bacterium]|tara:strand:+ start:1513 stop:1956 length:444 start_codon:yes stop_codon:yes gene_type:complete